MTDGQTDAKLRITTLSNADKR